MSETVSFTSESTSCRPEPSFRELGLDACLLRAVDGAGFTKPRPIQSACIPAVLAGGDVLGLAQTGTGKTAAFALPILERLRRSARPGPRALILAPTRELATQIHAELRLLAKHTKLTAVTVFGGAPAGPQIRALRARPDVIVACPGRLLDLLEQGAAKLDAIETVVLDEADHMFDLGFLPDVRRILAALPRKRQNLLFSATMPAEIRKLADALLVRPHVVELAHSRPLETIEHALYPVSQDRKEALLRHVLDDDTLTSAIVFSRTKRRAKKLADHLSRNGHSAVALQGNMTQTQRERAMTGFRQRRYAILVATDIAARGIDVAGVSHVINFDMPSTPEAYTHRIGRTGRAERSGKAYTFVAHEDHAAVRALERRLGAAIERRNVPGLTAGAAAGSARKATPERVLADPKPGDGRPRQWQGRGRRANGPAGRRRTRTRPQGTSRNGARDRAF
jgi:ATP-dependent RNA helicase RhlE